METPELLAPAGDWECARAAVENGADAIYFGLEKFNARMRAHNFTVADLPELMMFLHRRGVKGYVTFNTLVFSNELAEAEGCLRSIISAGVDAVIVQDVGICRLIRDISPDFPIHASTQMTVTSAAGVEFVKNLGCQLVVLARECSISEIEKIRNESATASANVNAKGHEISLEVFVHGALCVAYSGQCLTSEALGGRSANRGECAQACRMPYELLCDGKKMELGDRRYLLSPQDLAGLDVLPELVEAGVSSLKIEGRLKSPEYVASITRVYREALDALGKPSKTNSENRAPRYEMEMAFSRGLYTGWLGGIDNQRLVHARFGKKRGVYLGEVGAVNRESVEVSLDGPLKAGDGVVFDCGQPEQPEQGGRVYTLKEAGPRTILNFQRGAIDFQRIPIGAKVWKTSDPDLDKKLRQTFSQESPQHRRPVDAEVHGREGSMMTLLVNDTEGNSVRVDSAINLMKAEKHSLDDGRLRDQLGRLGGTAFELRNLVSQLEGAVMLPMSELNRMRRDAIAKLDALRSAPKRWTMSNEGVVRPSRRYTDFIEVKSELIVLVRSLPQLEAAIEAGVSTVYCEFEDPKKYRDTVAQFRRATNSDPSKTIWIAPPRITKPGEEWILRLVRSAGADGYLVRNYDHLQAFEGARRRGDFSLNVANELSAQYWMEEFKLERVTASYDLNLGQLEGLLRAAPPEWFEITLHQHMPMFHMEHCVFCAFLSSGKDYRDCGRPCDKHEVRLRDRVGMEHPLKADAGCRNTLFNAVAQTGAEHFQVLQRAGARNFRIEFLNESREETRGTIGMYQDLLTGKISGAQIWRELRLMNQLGVTRGQM